MTTTNTNTSTARTTTINLPDKAVDELQDLIRINIDSCKGFESAAETVENEKIANQFRTIAKNRRANADELRKLVEMTDEEAEDSGSIRGAIHRWWATARGKLSGGDDHTVLSEAERGEDAIKDRYEEALGNLSVEPARDLVHRQFVEVKATHDAVRDLRDSKAENK